ncbi:MAG TPA: hypothetical protein VFE47_28510 [Tepidisphaeraceae bacterium]|jgi:Amt family ammonium transporter|nr:hypothetical protein [Tepidisphaeraceae bacterium]
METFIILGALALLTRAGFALYAGGLVRAKNSAATVMRLLADLSISVVAFWAIGAAILFQRNNQWLGILRDLLVGIHTERSVVPFALIFVRLAMILTATGLVAGALAERCKFWPLCAASAVLAGFVLPATCGVTWTGWLAMHGFVDLAGGSALHVAGGAFALVAVVMVGPRAGKFNRDGSSSNIPGHNLPLAAMGVLLMLVGWIAYVIAGSAVILAPQSMREGAYGPGAMNVLLAAACAGLGSLLYTQVKYGKPEIVLTLAGIVGGMVSACAGGAWLPSWAAAITGLVAGVIVPLAVIALELRGRLDDPLGVIAIHIVGGAWGTIAAGIFIPIPLAPRGRGEQILIQAVGVIGIAIFAAAVSAALFLILRATVGLRSKEADEFDGLDLAEHDIGAYPDFQQNSIKSYHLREA